MNIYSIEFSVYGSNPTPAWRKAITTTMTVTAANEDAAREAACVKMPSLAGDRDAIRSVTVR